MTHRYALLNLILLGGHLATLAQAPTLVTRLPAANAPSVPRNGSVELTFSEAMSAQTASADAVRVVSQWRGLLPGTYTGGGTNTISFTPSSNWWPGEPLTVGVTSQASSLATGAAVLPTQFPFTAAAPAGSSRFSFEEEVLNVGFNPQSAATGDLNGDGRPDLAVVNSGSDNVSIRLGNGDGTFTNAPNVTVGTTPSSVLLTDVNNDGKLDLLTPNSAINSVSVCLGMGNADLAVTLA